MYTKEEMLEGGPCPGRVICSDCPFERIGGELVFKPDCYKENVAQYKKEKMKLYEAIEKALENPDLILIYQVDILS